jgi:ADP-ribose pyrophosphatase YjhB (NUDIX family)
MPPQTRLRVSVLALFIDVDDVLLIHQMDPPEPDCWDLPGGGLEAEESILEGLRREVQEETGIEEFQVDRLLTVIDTFFPEGNGKVLHSLNIIYQCSILQRPINLSSTEAEIGPKGIQWLAIANLTPQECSTRSWQAIQECIKNQNL